MVWKKRFSQRTFSSPDDRTDADIVPRKPAVIHFQYEEDVVVRGDDRELFSATVSGSDELKPLRVVVAGVQRMELLVNFARDDDTGDRADWADLRLVR